MKIKIISTLVMVVALLIMVQPVYAGSPEDVFDSAAYNILKCFHPTAGMGIRGYENYSKEGSIYKIIGTINYLGAFSGNGYQMKVRFNYDTSDQTGKVVLLSDNAIIPANPNCAMRGWISISQFGDAAKNAGRQLFAGAVATIIVGAIATDQADKRAQKSFCDSVDWPKSLGQCAMTVTIEGILQERVVWSRKGYITRIFPDDNVELKLDYPESYRDETISVPKSKLWPCLDAGKQTKIYNQCIKN